MEYLFTTVPGIIVSVGGLFTVCAVGVTYGLGLWKKNKDGEDDRLINILEKTVKELGTKVTYLEGREKELTEEVHSLREENKKYIAILEGRDEQTREFYKRAFESMGTTKDTHEIVKTMAGSVTELVNQLKNSDIIKTSTTVVKHK